MRRLARTRDSRRNKKTHWGGKMKAEEMEKEKAKIIGEIIHRLERCTIEEIKEFIFFYHQEKRQASARKVLPHQDLKNSVL